MATGGKIMLCPLCFEPFARARFLPCSHQFCESCLGTYIKKNIIDSGVFQCPVCDVQTSLTRQFRNSIEDVQYSFPLAVLDETAHCNTCQEDGLKVTAAGFCLQCSEYLCADCAKYHGRLSATKSHTFLTEESDMNFEAIATFAFHPVCSDHGGMQMSVLCRDHNIFCCSVCVATVHRNCKSVVSVEKASTGDVASTDEASENLQTLCDALSSFSVAIDQNRSSIMKEKRCLRELKCIHDALQKHISELFSAKEAEITIVAEKADRSLQHSYNDAKKLLLAIKSTKHLLDEVPKRCPPKDLFCFEEKMKMLLKSYEKQVSNLTGQTKKLALEFKPNDDFLNLVRKTPSAGKIVVSKSSFASSHPRMECSGIRVRLSEEENDSEITDLTVCQTGQIVAVDKGNRKIKCITLNPYTVSSFHCEHVPCGIAVFKAGDMLVTFPPEKCFVLGSIGQGSKIFLGKTVPTPEMFFDVVTLTEGLFAFRYSSTAEQTGIIIADTECSVKFKFDQTTFGGNLFTCISSIAYDRQEGVIYVADKFSGCLCVTIEQKRVCKLRPAIKLRHPPHGICVDELGSVYVTCSIVGEIYRCRKGQGTFEKLDIQNVRPKSVWWDEVHKCLYISDTRVSQGNMLLAVSVYETFV